MRRSSFDSALQIASSVRLGLARGGLFASSEAGATLQQHPSSRPLAVEERGGFRLLSQLVVYVWQREGRGHADLL